MKIVHFSDPHAGGWPSSGSAFFDKRIIGALNYNLRRRKHFKLEVLEQAVARILFINPQVVIITGDITSIGDPNEFQTAMQILAPLVESIAHVFYVPGNHDCYVKNKSCQKMLADAFYYLNQCRNNLDQLPTSTRIQNVNFIQLNQVIPRNIFMSDGILNPASIDLLNSPRFDNEIRIAIGHFPTCDAKKMPLAKRRQLRNFQPLQDALRQGKVDISLCGHIHTPFLHLHGNAMEICAGSITANAHLNILEINQIESTIAQHWEIIPSFDKDNNLHNFKLIPSLGYAEQNTIYCNVSLKTNCPACQNNPN
ncbi:MAG: metallophosphoesterase family protein [Lentisphaeria bacterium]